MLELPKGQSFFLFGARGTGKSSLLKERFSLKKTLWLDLLNDTTLEKYLLSPQMLVQEVEGLKPRERPKWIVIDEVQKVPKLLNAVHQMIESDLGIHFALTGSSSRRLKQKGVNLLAGRAKDWKRTGPSLAEGAHGIGPVINAAGMAVAALHLRRPRTCRSVFVARRCNRPLQRVPEPLAAGKNGSPHPARVLPTSR
ncbi:MAG: AAA family ATPase [Deltaproteobacteria bacterium]|nr:AAA family ATPase [Deltaproteobacteria bacterium]